MIDKDGGLRIRPLGSRHQFLIKLTYLVLDGGRGFDKGWEHQFALDGV
jgi:hypothetical protein